MVTDTIADLLTRVRNASQAGHVSLTIPGSKTKERILKVFQEEGYVDRVDAFKDSDGKPFIKVFLRYTNDGEPVIRELKRLSSPGKRSYVNKDNIPHNRGGLGVVVVSTSRGMLSDRDARDQGIGGELVCSIF